MPIVTVNASITVAPVPSLLQQSGALVTQGGTSLSANTFAWLTQASDYTALIPNSLAIASISWSGGVAVVTTSLAIPGLATNDTFVTTIAGATPAGYNGLVNATVTGTNTFTYALTTNPGTETVAGTYTPPGQGELQSMVDTFFAEGTNRAVAVLELGAGNASTGPSSLGSWITANPGEFYSFLVPRLWDGSSGLLALLPQYEAPTAKTYFYVTTTTGTASAYSSAMKDTVALVQTPGAPLTEFTLAAPFQASLAYAPSATNRMTQFGFAYLYGVTPYPTQGNAATLAALKAQNVNYVGTGAEGGITNNVLFWGDTLSGTDVSWWYSADWAQINCDLTVANIVINGSNNPLNPLYFNQNGINTLQDGLVQTLSSAVAYGLAAGTVTRSALSPSDFSQAVALGKFAGQNVVNAVPFTTYVAQAHGDYALGKYSGLSVVYIPQNGFKQIIFDVNVTNLLSQ